MTKMEKIRAPAEKRKTAPARPGRAPAGPARQVPAPIIEPPRRARFPVAATLSFLLLVFLPVTIVSWYALGLAADRYASRAAFSIRASETSPPQDLAGLIAGPAGVAAVDAQILYDFLHSQDIVRRIARRLDLADIFSATPTDPIFNLSPGQPIEDVVWHWTRMVDVGLDPSSGILTVEARAFTPIDAQRITSAIIEESAALANRLSDKARRRLVDATGREVEESEQRLRAIRLKLRRFRDGTQNVDPTQSATATLGLVSELEGELARARVQLAELAGVLSAEAPQVRTLRRRIATLETRIAEERTRLGRGAQPSEASETDPLSTVVGRYEELLVDREFAEQAYTLALAAHQQALTEARRLHRHLAIHIEPTLSERAEYPVRGLWIAIALIVCLAGWAMLHLVMANIAERR